MEVSFIFLKHIRILLEGECLKECLKPIQKIKRDLSFLFQNYEKSCNILEEQFKRIRKCELKEQQTFFSATIWYRLFCVDFEEDLEEHFECLKSASFNADKLCRTECFSTPSPKTDKLKKVDKEAKMCEQIKCSTVCYYKSLSQSCPSAQPTLLKMNLRQSDDMYHSTHKETLIKMPKECKDLHDTQYMKGKMLE
uniref:CPG4 domain-containing protein n=1 Tax=Rhabditophanes sp. KR3021 TaxID=114890 RepID=A0AC35TN47_9BILA